MLQLYDKFKKDKHSKLEVQTGMYLSRRERLGYAFYFLLFQTVQHLSKLSLFLS